MLNLIKYEGIIKVGIHQPNYLPWIGYFTKILLSDYFIFLDDVQFSNEGMHHWHYLKTPQGPIRIKIPICQTLGDRINEVKTRDELGWKSKHLKSIELNYKKASHYQEVYRDLAELILHDYDNIALMNIAIISFICAKLGISTRLVNSSSFNVPTVGVERIIDLVKAVNGTDYISGMGARSYQDDRVFQEKGIRLHYLHYIPIVYDQLWGPFHANVSIIDYLMNCGYDLRPIVKGMSYTE